MMKYPTASILYPNSIYIFLLEWFAMHQLITFPPVSHKRFLQNSLSTAKTITTKIWVTKGSRSEEVIEKKWFGFIKGIRSDCNLYIYVKLTQKYWRIDLSRLGKNEISYITYWIDTSFKFWDKLSKVLQKYFLLSMNILRYLSRESLFF